MDRRHKRKPIYGVGINDADYNVYWRGEDGKQKTCHFYRTRVGMLTRCYREDHTRNITYKDTKVCDEWFLFSNFKQWMQKQPFKNNQLEKDILVKGNNLYDPRYCVFVPQYINSVFRNYAKGNHHLPLGVTVSNKNKNPYAVYVLTKYIGNINDKWEGHKIWQKLKSEHYMDLYDQYIKEEYYDSRVADKILHKSWEISLDLYLNRETVEA